MMRAVVFTACDTQDIINERDAISTHWAEQIAAYENCDTVGLVFIFITDGYRGVLAREDSWINLDKERRMRSVFKEITDGSGARKIQIVGVRELISTMSSLERRANATGSNGGTLARLLLAEEKYLYYDSPKMIEAIIRIARGTHMRDELIFRMDADVKPNNKGFQKLFDYYDNLPAALKGEKGFHFFSGGYQVHADVDLINDFALRAHHFAPVGSKSLTASTGPQFSVARKWMDSIKEIGADPYDQVISGAGLCISEFAIESLPPFSNMEQLIVWIDDHIKNDLHESLGHFKSRSNPDGRNLHHYCPEARFQQTRYPAGIQKEDIESRSIEYLKRLVRGCLMDALIKGPYGSYVQMLLADSIKVSSSTLDRMRPVAEKRLGKIIEMWSDSDYKDYPVGRFTEDILPKEGQILIDQVIRDLGRYLGLLEQWPQFVGLIQHINVSEDSNWLFKAVVR